MSAATCGNCHFWGKMTHVQGECHRYPPTITVNPRLAADGHQSFDSTFPQPLEFWWCGEFKMSEPVKKNNRPPPPPPPSRF